jgi:hypothetical protein
VRLQGLGQAGAGLTEQSQHPTTGLRHRRADAAHDGPDQVGYPLREPLTGVGSQQPGHPVQTNSADTPAGQSGGADQPTGGALNQPHDATEPAALEQLGQVVGRLAEVSE